MAKGLIVAMLVIVLALGIYFLASSGDSSITGNTVAGDSISGSDTMTFVLTGENFKFVMDGVDNPDLVVKKGDTVRIEFSSTQGFHDWVVDAFDAATDKVRDTDGSTYVEFVADQEGTFEYYCSVGQHRANGMFGKFIVE